MWRVGWLLLAARLQHHSFLGVCCAKTIRSSAYSDWVEAGKIATSDKAVRAWSISTQDLWTYRDGAGCQATVPLMTKLLGYYWTDETSGIIGLTNEYVICIGILDISDSITEYRWAPFYRLKTGNEIGILAYKSAGVLRQGWRYSCQGAPWILYVSKLDSQVEGVSRQQHDT